MGIDLTTFTQATSPFSSIHTSRMSIPRVSFNAGFGHDGSIRVFTTAGIIGVHTLVEPAQSVCVMAGELIGTCAPTSIVSATVTNLIIPPLSTVTATEWRTPGQ